MKTLKLEIAQNIGRIKILQRMIDMNLLLAIYHLGFKIGYRYWRINRYYAKHPDEMQEFISSCRQKAILEPHFPWASFADQCQKSLDKYKLTSRK